jgi:putative ABC transport system permease protein
MFGYFLELALRSLKRSPGLAALMVLAIGFGVAASMTTYSVFRAVSGDPIPWKSSKLFVPQIDMWGTSGHGTGEPPDGMDYADALALMHAHRGTRQSAMYQISPLITPSDASKHPFNAPGHAVSSEFFPMVDAPFLYGNGWSATDDAQQAAVVVISSKLNQRLFGGGDSVGKTLHLEGKDYRVAGVLEKWNPQPRYYDIFNSGGFSSRIEDVFVPFERAIAVELSNAGQLGCKMAPTEAGFAAMQRSSCQWISYMVELDDAAAVTAYRQYLDNYAREQQQIGRFSWPPNNRLRNLPDWLDYQQVVPRDTKVSVLVALGLLIVCLVNTASLLLAKFLRRSGEIGVRRALGAPRRAIYGQFLTEAGLVGLAGGVLGLLLTALGVLSVSWVLPKDIAALTRVDGPLLILTLLVAVIATVLAGLYPTFRAARVQPAWQLKSN